jgi:hypothetical protein
MTALAEAATPGPYFVGDDTASDCGQHRNSGLALVDTGRTGDWPIARLCYWNSAAHISAWFPERAKAALAVIVAARQMYDAYCECEGDAHADAETSLYAALHAWDALAGPGAQPKGGV